MPLSRPVIIEAALKLLNEVGLDGLSTRRLGAVLGVEGPALYRHFATKQELIDEMARALFRTMREMPTGLDWAESVVTRARLTRHAILSHRDGARLIANAWPQGMDVDAITLPFRDAGFSRREAIYIHIAFGRFIIGWTSSEQAMIGRDLPPEHNIDGDEAFDFSLETLIAGLRVRLIRLAPPHDDSASSLRAASTAG